MKLQPECKKQETSFKKCAFLQPATTRIKILQNPDRHAYIEMRPFSGAF